jgi:hypothetical protein
MPQLVKGGKYIFGWTRLNHDLSIRVPDETFDEYHFKDTDTLIIMSGSKSSSGFSVAAPGSIINSKMSEKITQLTGYKQETDSFKINRLEIIKIGKRFISWTSLDQDKYFRLSIELVTLFNLEIGCNLLVGRGSGIGPAFIAKGIIYQEALKHRNLLEFH